MRNGFRKQSSSPPPRVDAIRRSMLAAIRNTRINLPSPSVYSPPGLIGPWLIHTCPNHFSFVSCEYESILFFFSLSRKQRRTAVLEINKKCLTSFEKLGEAIYKQEKEIVYFFSLHFPRIIYSRKLGLSSRVILIRLLVFRVIAFYGPCLEIVCKLAAVKILITLEDYRLWSSYRSPAFYFYFFHQ